MINQPFLSCQTAPVSETQYVISYHNEYLKPDDPFLDESHIHDYYELYLNLSGDISFLVNNHLYAVHGGDVIVTRPGDVHLCILNAPCVHEHYCLWIKCTDGSDFSVLLRRVFAQEHYSFGKTSEQFVTALDVLRSEKTTGWQKTSALLKLLVYLEERSDVSSSLALAAMPSEMQEIVDDINENFAEIRHIGDLLARHYVSRATLTRWFRKYMHLSPKEFLEAKKLSYAKTLLENGMSVTDVHMQVGFGDCSHFISVFKKRFGETPFRYKNQIK